MEKGKNKSGKSGKSANQENQWNTKQNVMQRTIASDSLVCCDENKLMYIGNDKKRKSDTTTYKKVAGKGICKKKINCQR